MKPHETIGADKVITERKLEAKILWLYVYWTIILQYFRVFSVLRFKRCVATPVQQELYSHVLTGRMLKIYIYTFHFIVHIKRIFTRKKKTNSVSIIHLCHIEWHSHSNLIDWMYLLISALEQIYPLCWVNIDKPFWDREGLE